MFFFCFNDKIKIGGKVESKKGIVTEVYIPVEGPDIYSSNKIGFKIKVDNEIITLEETQDDFNIGILKNDEVSIIKQTIGDKEFIDIEKVDNNG